MIFREFIPDDIESIAKVDVTSYKAQFSEIPVEEMAFELEGRKTGYEDLRSGKDRAFVACEGDTVVGYIQYGKGSEGKEWIKRLYILPEIQNQGLGRKLLGKALDGFKSTKVYINVWEDNPRASYLYSSLGFKPSGRKTSFLNKKGDVDGFEIEMAKELS